MRVVTDADIRAHLTAADAVGWMREAILAAHDGRLHTPPRVHAELGDGNLVFTTGALTGEWYGYRSYDTFDTDPGSQLVVVHDWHTGNVRGVAVGNELGPDLIDRADLVVTDSVAQTHAYDPPFVLAGTPQHDRLIGLGEVLTGTASGRTVVFCSVGLAGTEAYLLARLVDSAPWSSVR